MSATSPTTDYDGCHFIIINAQIVNSGFAAEAEQRVWLEADLEANRDKRIFLHSHYPPYLSKPDEEENYDNIGEPGRTWLLSLLEKYGVEALLIGHVHNFWFYRHAETDCYLLPSTAFVRLDYSEMYRISPGPDSEYGRNDKAKLGYFVVHVHEKGHVCDIVRTYGTEAALGSPDVAASRCVASVHPRLNRRGDFGLDMRQNWMEIIEIPPTGGLHEFDRKEVRNDYPLMALWEMGVKKVRVPLRDLLIPENIERMRTLRAHGHEFTLFSFGDPAQHHRDLIAAHHDVFSAWEICLNWEILERDIGGVGEIARAVEMPVYLSRLRTITEQHSEAGKYYHAINQGFLADDRSQMAQVMARPELSGALDGFVFRLTLEMSPWATAAAASQIAAGLSVAASLHLRMCSANPALEVADDHLSVTRIAEAMAAAAAFDNVTVYADTFVDFDRGYFPRTGVLDRLFNPRPGFHVVRHMNAALNTVSGALSAGAAGECTGGRYVQIQAEQGPIVLALPDSEATEMSVPFGAGHGKRIDLGSGEIVPAATGNNNILAITVPISNGVKVPILVIPG